jgi:hypothetical protein
MLIIMTIIRLFRFTAVTPNHEISRMKETGVSKVWNLLTQLKRVFSPLDIGFGYDKAV